MAEQGRPEHVRQVGVTVNSSGPGMTDGEDVAIRRGEGAAWSVPLGSTWEVKIDGRHVIGSGDATDLALPSPGDGRDVNICIRVAPDGALELYDGCVTGATRRGRAAERAASGQVRNTPPTSHVYAGASG